MPLKFNIIFKPTLIYLNNLKDRVLIDKIFNKFYNQGKIITVN